MTLTKWDPIRDLVQMQDRLSRVLTGSMLPASSSEELMNRGSWLPPVDIYETDKNELVIKGELPDMKREDIDITVDNNTLTIKGEKKVEDEVKDEKFHRIERQYGTFVRSFSLPPTVDATKVSAEYKNGVLTLRLPTKAENKPRQIQIAA